MNLLVESFVGVLGIFILFGSCAFWVVYWVKKLEDTVDEWIVMLIAFTPPVFVFLWILLYRMMKEEASK